MANETTKNERDWEKFFDIDKAKKTFVYSSFYLFAYEMLKNTIVERIKTFYFRGYDENGVITDETYKETVLKRKVNGKQNLFQAHLYWLKDNNVIDEDDIKEIVSIREHRDLIAHNTDKLVSDSDFEINYGLLDKTFDFIKKIDLWWIKEFEIPTNPDFDNVEVNTDEITSGYEFIIGYYKSIINSILTE